MFNEDRVTDSYSENVELIVEIVSTLMLFSKTVLLYFKCYINTIKTYNNILSYNL